MTQCHVIPIDDLEAHLFDGCSCYPVVETHENGNSIVVHRAFDGRHIVEAAVEGLGIKKSEDKGWEVIEYKIFS